MRLRGDQAIRQAADAARAFGTTQQLANDQLARLCIVVEELVANLYDHGGLTEEDEIEFAMAGDPTGIRISIVDPGMPFNPWSAPPTAESSGRGGGAGISLVQAWAQSVSYRSSAKGNHLELLLPVKKEETNLTGRPPRKSC